VEEETKEKEEAERQSTEHENFPLFALEQRRQLNVVVGVVVALYYMQQIFLLLLFCSSCRCCCCLYTRARFLLYVHI